MTPHSISQSLVRCFSGSALIFATAALSLAQEPTVSTNGNVADPNNATTSTEDQPPAPPEPKDEFTLLAERLTAVEVPKAKIDRSRIEDGITTKAAGLTDLSGKALVTITVDPATFPTYKIASGDRLYNIARKHYGSGHYGEYLAAYNEINPSKLTIGQEIRLPEIDDAFNAVGLYPLMSEECGTILKIRSDFMALEPALTDAAGKAITPEMKEQLLTFRKLTLGVMESLGSDKPGIREAPSSVQIQLRSCAENLNILAKGHFSTKHIARVHQRLGYAISYAIVWARNGYE
ncbi:MAG: LysM domain-containing protein [Verrucomicrobiales bacterium]